MRESISIKSRQRKSVRNIQGRAVSSVRDYENLPYMNKKGETDIDLVAGTFGHLMEELFVLKQDRWEPYLRKFGFFLGKFIYIMDAYDDLEKDLKERKL